MNWGLLFVGLHGASASTFVAGLQGPERDSSFTLGSYWCSLVNNYPEELDGIVIGGWDYRHSSLRNAIEANAILSLEADADDLRCTLFPAVIGPSDYAARVDDHETTHPNFDAAVDSLKTNIRDFQQANDLDRIIVINMSSPMYCGRDANAGWSSVAAYATAAIEEGADWVEFTPSDSVNEQLIEACSRTGSRIAGRDGSTGQTILKLVLRDFLKDRGLIIDSWYSTNLIGNRDGLVLSHDDYKVTKLRDKKSVLPASQAGVGTHIVEIQYVPPAGDNKESWDCVFFLGWLNTKMSLRLNWQGADSFLAAPLILDIVSGLIHAHKTGYPAGVVSPLGLFFKAPINAAGNRFDQLYTNFKDFVLN